MITTNQDFSPEVIASYRPLLEAAGLWNGELAPWGIFELHGALLRDPELFKLALASGLRDPEFPAALRRDSRLIALRAMRPAERQALRERVRATRPELFGK